MHRSLLAGWSWEVEAAKAKLWKSPKLAQNLKTNLKTNLRRKHRRTEPGKRPRAIMDQRQCGRLLIPSCLVL